MQIYASDHDVFLSVLQQHAEEVLPLVYTPTVGRACEAWSVLTPRPEGLYLHAGQRGRLREVAASWRSAEEEREEEMDVKTETEMEMELEKQKTGLGGTERKGGQGGGGGSGSGGGECGVAEDVRRGPKVAVVTDGERILGLGDLGAHGMGISVGKGLLYSAAAGLHPSRVVPVCLDVGTNNEALREDPLYIGRRHARLRGEEYAAFLEEAVGALRARFGADLMVHFEDFSAGNAWQVLRRFQNRGFPVFNDDIQGTAAAVGAALFGAFRVPGVVPLPETRLLLFGAGQANIGVARLFVRALVGQTGIPEEEARRRVWLMDSKGLIYAGRPTGGISEEKQEFAHPLTSLRPGLSGSGINSDSDSDEDFDTTDIAACVAATRATALVGAAARRGAFSPSVLARLTATLTQHHGPNSRPIVFALSNPTSKAECTAEEALRGTNYRAVFASGTAFAPVATPGGVTYHPAQANNALVFPGVGLGVLASGAVAISEDMFLAAALEVGFGLR